MALLLNVSFRAIVSQEIMTIKHNMIQDGCKRIFWKVYGWLHHKFLETVQFIPLEKIVNASDQVDILMLGIFSLATKCFISRNCLTGNNSDKT